jgi:cytochrome c-type biogenesis protein CcmH
MIWLWVAAAVISAGMAALVVQRAARAIGRSGTDNAALAVYRRQMAEIDELADRGLLADAERRSVRAETGRRLLAAAERVEPAAARVRPGWLLGAAALVPLAAAGLYLAIGAPDFADQPFAQRLAAWKAADPATLTPEQMAAVLRGLAAEHPTDPQPLSFLAKAQIEAGQPLEAVQALHRAIALKPDRADLWELLGVADTEVGNGEATPDAIEAFRHALALDPSQPTPRLYLARARLAAGDAPGALALLRDADAALKTGDPRKAFVQQAIDQVAKTGKLADTPGAAAQPPTIGGPQIQAMVDGLAARLKTNPDDPDGWVRLVRAYTVLGETDRRDAAIAEARKRFAGRADVQAALTAAVAGPK